VSNPAGAKGRAGENEAVDVFMAAGFPRADPEDPESPGVKRFRGGFESHDVQGVGSWVIEAKFRKAWHLFGWVRKIRRRADGRPWAIVAIHGDRRTVEGREVGRVMIFDADVGAMLIRHWEGTEE
jgi:hypothetical protein